jgi:hypothetical protein
MKFALICITKPFSKKLDNIYRQQKSFEDVGLDLEVCYGPSEIAWPALGGLAGRPSCELLGLGLALSMADDTDRGLLPWCA